MQPIIEKSDYGYWLKFGNRSRFIAATPEELSIIDLAQLEKTKRAFKQGSHEKSYYYRDAEGNICIPPEPSLVPQGVKLEEIDSLPAADRISKEIAEQHYRKFQDHGEFTEALEKQLGGPRQHLIERLQNPKSNYERDMVRNMLEELDSGRHDTSKIQSESFFHFREYDR